MRLVFSADAWNQYLEWQRADRKMVQRINTLMRDIQRDPFSGLGRPEQLGENLSGYWSRRINDQHRLVYKILGDDLVVVQLRYHY